MKDESVLLERIRVRRERFQSIHSRLPTTGEELSIYEEESKILQHEQEAKRKKQATDYRRAKVK